MRKMAGPFLAIFDDDDYDETSRSSRATPVYQRRLDALNELNDIELLRRYRIDKAGIEVCGVICYLLTAFFISLFAHSCARTSKRRITAAACRLNLKCSHFFNTAQVQRSSCTSAIATAFRKLQHLGELFFFAILSKLCVATFCSAVNNVAHALVRRASEFITLPTAAESAAIKRGFLAYGGFPNVVGALDGTHIYIVAPPRAVERQYVNRKSRHSINVQALVDHRGLFRQISAEWPGSSHDAHVLRSSALWPLAESHALDGYVLGDRGYPARRWLLTPFATPSNAAQRR